MKEILKKIVRSFGYKLSKNSNIALQDDNPFLATKGSIKQKKPVFFDVGANQGQTIAKIKETTPEAQVYAFEPNKTCYEMLSKAEKSGDVLIYNTAMGAAKAVLQFNEYTWGALSSFYKRAFTKSAIKETYEVDVITIDGFCAENNIPYINFLKTDTEGYELEVLKGAAEMMDNNRIQFVFTEIFFNENYIGQASFGDIYNFLLARNFQLVRFYEFEIMPDGISNRSDALFVNRKFIAE